MTTRNPFRLRCAECGTPWREVDKTCWACGSTQSENNPDYGMPINRTSDRPATYSTPLPSVATRTRASEISNTPYIVVTLVIGVVFLLLAYEAVRSVTEAVAVGLFAAGIAWTNAQITITRRRTERIEQLLTEMGQRSWKH